jgi:DnaK suppressor protein
MSALTTAQRTQLESALRQRQSSLDSRLAEHQGGLSRADYAHELRDPDGRDDARREGERGLAMSLSDLETRELGVVSQALARLRAGDYGRCGDCDTDIPFARLQAEPWALRCVACESVRERAARR